MGIFGFKNKYDIEPKEKDLTTLVTKANVDVLKMNAKVVVPTNHFFVIGKKGKVYDKFEAGEYFLNYTMLPQMCRKFGIDKVKNGESQDKIPADLYFVSRELRAGIFKTYRKVEMGTKAYGFFSAHVQGMYSYRVSDVKEFMQSLLNEYDYIKTGEAEGIIESWVSEVVVSELEKQNFILDDVIKNSPIITDALKNRVSKLFSVAGLELVSLQITKYKLPNKYQEQSDKNIKAQKEGLTSENGLQVNESVLAQHQQNKQSLPENQSLEQEEPQNSISDDQKEAKRLLEEFGIGDIKINQMTEIENDNQDIINLSEGNEIKRLTDEASIIKEQNKEVSDEYVPFGSFVIEDAKEINKEKAKNAKEAKTFVDLTLSELYTNEERHTKRCLSCGAENPFYARECKTCGELLN